MDELWLERMAEVLCCDKDPAAVVVAVKDLQDQLASAKLDAGEFVKEVASFEDSGKLYLLQNVAAGYVGNSPVFWCQDDSGYTPWIAEAKRWTLEEAGIAMNSTIGSHCWKLWPLDQVLQKAQLTVDIQQLRK